MQRNAVRTPRIGIPVFQLVLENHGSKYLDIRAANKAIDAFYESGPQVTISLQERKVSRLASYVAFMQDKLVMANEIKLQPLNLRYDLFHIRLFPY